MPAPPATGRTRPLLRGRTIAGGAALAGVLLLVLTALGGVGGTPLPPAESHSPDRLGPLTALQPQLHHALLSDADLPPLAGAGVTTPPGAVSAAPPPAGRTSPAATDPAERSQLGELCRSLFEDPASLSGWWEGAPQEASWQRTGDHRGGILQQVLALFAEEQVRQSYAQLRETASRCGRFTASLADGTVVTVMLDELATNRRESAHADEAYTLRIIAEDGQQTLVGWLALDRVGPVVSVLRRLGPAGAGPDDLASTRQAALSKVRAMLQMLSGGGQPSPDGDPGHTGEPGLGGQPSPNAR
jgi:hypothetical protein